MLAIGRGASPSRPGPTLSTRCFPEKCRPRLAIRLTPCMCRSSGARATSEARYAPLLTDGTIWVWEYSTDASQSLLVLLAGPILGLALGGVVVLALLVLSAARRRAGAGSG